MQNVVSFRNDKYFLSNMYPCKINYEGYTYNNVEAAFQAQKNSSPEYKSELSSLTGKYAGQEAKRAGRKIKLRSDWESVKNDIMLEIVRAKFNQNKILKDKLLKIPNSELIEYNTWHDNYWGSCTCFRCRNKVKHNILGKILIIIKEELLKKEQIND